MNQNPEFTASGHDVASLWLNMVKILIGLSFIYQNTLYEQLNMDLFKDQFYLFTAHDNHQKSVEAPPVISSDNPILDLAFLPLSVGAEYGFVNLRVTRMVRKDAATTISVLNGPRDVGRISWPEEGASTGNALTLRRFNLFDFVASEDLLAGDYEISFEGDFVDKNGKKLATRPGANEDKSQGVVSFRYVTEDAESFGDLPIVQCQSLPFPSDLRGKWLVPDPTDNSCAGIDVDNAHMVFSNPKERRLAYDARDQRRNTCTMKGTYQSIAVSSLTDSTLQGRVEGPNGPRDITVNVSSVPPEIKKRLADSKRGPLYITLEDADVPQNIWSERPSPITARSIALRNSPEVPFLLHFVVKPNLRPRPIYKGGTVGVIYPKDRYLSSASGGDPSAAARYEYINLSRFIVDPDSETGSLLPTHVTVPHSDNYSITRNPDRNQPDFRLRIGRGDRVRDGDEVLLSVSDDCWTVPIKVVIRRDGGGGGL